MCGIAGFCDFSSDYLQYTDKWERILKDMRSAIAHRGPDQAGEYLRPMVGLSQARLSIRDIQGGRQPMVRQKNGVEYAIVYNGEIYNTDELKPALEAAGYQFETAADTEVVLYAYMEYGADFVTMLNGIFAIVIWDGKLNRLVLYRDRVGVKPLFYALRGNELVFGSEPKALFCHPDITPEVDMDSFRAIFGIGPARIPGCGVFKNIQEIKPGCMGVFSAEGFRESAYWTLIAREHTDDYAQTVETVSYPDSLISSSEYLRYPTIRNLSFDHPSLLCFIFLKLFALRAIIPARNVHNKTEVIINAAIPKGNRFAEGLGRAGEALRRQIHQACLLRG